ncbi:MAG: lysophospholipid acyltransferase family protein [Bacteroidales bacterium]|nr:lysophospholipid acyltransferase family protein [Bacteroidales bacterium]
MEKHNLVSTADILKAAKLEKLGGEGAAKLLMSLLKINKINKYYSNNIDKEGTEFIKAILDQLQISFEIGPNDLDKIPKSGPFVTISNHPYGGIDGLLLLRLISEARKDFKVMVNFLLQKIKPIEDLFIPVNPFENWKDAHSSLGGIKSAFEHLKKGNSLGIFPAGEVSSFNNEALGIIDKQWQYAILKFIKKAEVPVVPIYFHGTNSRLFHLLGLIHPVLRTVKLPSEIFNKRNKVIKIRIGDPISIKEQKEFTDIARFGRYLRAKTYALGTTIEVRKFFTGGTPRIMRVEKVIDPIPKDLINEEISYLIKKYKLFTNKNYSVICAPSFEMPNIMNELGRLREITFREVGEGTNRKLDLDEYDLYYYQLFIWDHDNECIVGAYRVGKGKDIVEQYGRHGFYIQSLFRISPRFTPILNESLELGRSFIVPEYQKHTLPLFLLWKGILYFLLKNPEYRYLIGPVSISNMYSKFSRTLIIEFIKANFYNYEFAKYIKSRKKFKVQPGKVDTDILVGEDGDIKRLDKILEYIQSSGFRLPVLVKKYLNLGGRIIGFNLDPKFNNALDGLLILDLFDVPMDTVSSLSKEINDESILERFYHDLDTYMP